MSNIAFLGLGAMGSRMVVHLIEAGHDVTVWNRSPAATQGPAKLGANVAASPREAALKADFVFCMVTDDEASESVWMNPKDGALVGLQPGAVAIELSTLSPEWLGDLSAAAQLHGASLIDAPVAGSLPQAESGKLVVFAGGEEAVVARVTPLLQCFAAAVHHIGPTGRGLVMKLGVNSLLAIQVSAIAETIAALENSGITPEAAHDVLSTLPIASPAGNWIAGLMISNDFNPRFTASLMRKDLRYGVHAAEQTGSRTPFQEAALALFGSLCDKGLGGENISAAIKDFR